MREKILMKPDEENEAILGCNTCLSHDIYIENSSMFYSDRLENIDSKDNILEDEILNKNSKKVAVSHAVQNIQTMGYFCLMVGLGKSFIGARQLLNGLEINRTRSPQLSVPPSLIEMWERHNDVYQLNSSCSSMGLLQGR